MPLQVPLDTQVRTAGNESSYPGEQLKLTLLPHSKSLPCSTPLLMAGGDGQVTATRKKREKEKKNRGRLGSREEEKA